MATMAAPEAVTSALQTSVAAGSLATEALHTSVAAVKATEIVTTSTFGLFGRVVLSMLSVLPSVLYWMTYTLPTLLFTLFSMSLTFTMNFTTL